MVPVLASSDRDLLRLLMLVRDVTTGLLLPSVSRLRDAGDPPPRRDVHENAWAIPVTLVGTKELPPLPLPLHRLLEASRASPSIGMAAVWYPTLLILGPDGPTAIPGARFFAQKECRRRSTIASGTLHTTVSNWMVVSWFTTLLSCFRNHRHGTSLLVLRDRWGGGRYVAVLASSFRYRALMTTMDDCDDCRPCPFVSLCHPYEAGTC
jgi:hypothetical protein